MAGDDIPPETRGWATNIVYKGTRKQGHDGPVARATHWYDGPLPCQRNHLVRSSWRTISSRSDTGFLSPIVSGKPLALCVIVVRRIVSSKGAALPSTPPLRQRSFVAG